MIRTFLCAALLAVAVPATAHDMGGAAHGEHAEAAMAVSDVWASPSPGGNGAAYAMIMNGGAADRLIAVKSDLAAAVELHTMSEDGGIMQMRKIDAVDVPAGGMVMLESGGTHVMLIGLKAPLREGMTGTLTFVFEHAGEVNAELTVRAGGSGGGHEHH